MLKQDRQALDEAERRARLAVCDILAALGTMPRERVPAVAAALEAALKAAKGETAKVVVEPKGAQ